MSSDWIDHGSTLEDLPLGSSGCLREASRRGEAVDQDDVHLHGVSEGAGARGELHADLSLRLEDRSEAEPEAHEDFLDRLKERLSLDPRAEARELLTALLLDDPPLISASLDAEVSWARGQDASFVAGGPRCLLRMKRNAPPLQVDLICTKRQNDKSRKRK